MRDAPRNPGTPVTLTPGEIDRFRCDGYLKFRRVLEPDRLEILRATLDRIIAEELEREDDAGLPPELAFGHDRKNRVWREGTRAIHQFVNVWKVAPEYRALLDQPAITGAVRDLMGVPRIRLWHDQVISKPPGDNRHFDCHHDFYFWPLDRPAMITCWLALDDATVENGCMHVIPGSHRDPRFQPAGCDLSPELHLSPASRGPGSPASLYDEVRTWGADRAVPVELEAGECMFHHCLNYHLTPENRTDRQRRAFVMIFMPDGTRFNPAQSPRHPCTSYLDLEAGQELAGPEFPLCGPESVPREAQAT